MLVKGQRSLCPAHEYPNALRGFTGASFLRCQQRTARVS
jgi:hypothetical protein